MATRRRPVDLIIHHCIISRGLRRALRLKLVCKPFRASFERTLFPTRVLDDAKWGHHFREARWGLRKHNGATVLWHDYLVFRCRARSKSSEPALWWAGKMRSVLDSLIRYHRRVQSQAQDDTARDTDEMLEKLCWVVINGCKTGCEGWEYLGEEHTGPHNLGLSTLSAATYFGYASLARELLDQDSSMDPTKRDGLFHSPMYIAARTGQADMLQLLQGRLPEFEHGTPNGPRLNWRSKLGPGSLRGACVRGDLDMVRL
ncbi:hypothetical protein B0H67DRAFT_642553 [Lasiosphaeris hirsuta]|uniref:Ankyrin n=1 Tax=Lasiosphaeris hirsuta TaxID=260670 RepID=A0AA40ANM8_9PEZI|nr:hypothetical protein B0H67DRAFT_642553 [Lasiosphaeris hirsuta]